MRLAKAYGLGVLAATALALVVSFCADRLEARGIDSPGGWAQAAMFFSQAALVVFLVGLTTAWAPFFLVLAAARRLRHPPLGLCLAASALAALSIEPLFVTLSMMLTLPLRIIDYNNRYALYPDGTGPWAEFDGSLFARLSIDLAPLMLLYGCFAGLVFYRLARPRSPSDRPILETMS